MTFEQTAPLMHTLRHEKKAVARVFISFLLCAPWGVLMHAKDLLHHTCCSILKGLGLMLHLLAPMTSWVNFGTKIISKISWKCWSRIYFPIILNSCAGNKIHIRNYTLTKIASMLICSKYCPFNENQSNIRKIWTIHRHVNIISTKYSIKMYL